METNERLVRLIADEAGYRDAEEIDNCRKADVADRIQSLEELKSDVETGSLRPVVNIFSCLGDETRYTIVRLLIESDKQLCVCELEAITEVSQSGLSHALSDLQDAGLVAKEKRGRWRYYQPTDRARTLLAAIEDTPPEATPEL